MTTATDDRRALAARMFGHCPYQYCALCGAQIHWIKTAKNGKQMPCDLPMLQGDGQRTLVLHNGEVIVRAGPERSGYESHFGSCKVYREAAKACKTGGKTVVKRLKRRETR